MNRDSFFRQLKNVHLSHDEMKEIATSIGIRVRKQSPLRPERRMGTTAFISRLKRTQLTGAERARALEYIHQHLSRKHEQRWLGMKRMMSAIFAGIILLVSGGVTATYAAQESVPGETLYAWKVRVAEPIAGLMHMTSEGRAAWAIERADRRLHETAMLMKKRAMTPEARQMMHEEFKKHAAEAQVFVDELEKQNMTGAMEMSDRIEQRLHERSLELRDAEGEDGPQEEMNPFFDEIVHSRTRLGRLALKHMKPLPSEAIEATERPGPAVMMMSAPQNQKRKGVEEGMRPMKPHHPRRMPTREELRTGL